MLNHFPELIRNYSYESFCGESEVDGIVKTTYNDAVNISAVVLPMTLKEMQSVPEGQRTLQWINVWSQECLKEKDRICFDEESFEVQKLSQRHHGDYFKAQAVKTKDSF